MNIYAITNVAAVAEEVIEGVYAGQIYQDISSSDMSDVLAGSRNKKVEPSTISFLGSSNGKSGGEISATKEIEVVLDIAHEDFTFSAQPGALRRVSYSAFLQKIFAPCSSDVKTHPLFRFSPLPFLCS